MNTISVFLDKLAGAGFEPHGFCYLWIPKLILLHVVSDSVIALAYFSIPALLVYFVRKRQDIPFTWLFLMFGIFIVSCGTTHIISIYEIWHGAYWLSGYVKAITAISSIATAIAMVPLLPRALALKSPAELDIINRKLVHYANALEKSNRELDDFAYVASHDLKAPLRVIENASIWLEDDLREHLTEETRESMNLLRGRVRRMDKLLDDLLEYSRIGKSTDERSELIRGNKLIENILCLLSPPKNFTVNVSPRFADITVHSMPLQQILMNLISNAIKHHDKTHGCIEVTVEDADAYYAFAVKDDGPGIPAEFHDQIFKMFQTLKPRDKVEGSGMGLAMVRKNIEVFGGTFSLESAEGQGSLFRFTWPKQQVQKAPA
jgi:signal transduction histidine kinase